MEEKRLILIKILLKYVIEKNRQEEEFMKKIQDIKAIYNMEISLINNVSVYDIVPKEEKTEEIYEFFSRTDVSVNDLVDEFCEKYGI